MSYIQPHYHTDLVTQSHGMYSGEAEKGVCPLTNLNEETGRGRIKWALFPFSTHPRREIPQGGSEGSLYREGIAGV